MQLNVIFHLLFDRPIFVSVLSCYQGIVLKMSVLITFQSSIALIEITSC